MTERDKSNNGYGEMNPLVVEVDFQVGDNDILKAMESIHPQGVALQFDAAYDIHKWLSSGEITEMNFELSDPIINAVHNGTSIHRTAAGGYDLETQVILPKSMGSAPFIRPFRRQIREHLLKGLELYLAPDPNPKLEFEPDIVSKITPGERDEKEIALTFSLLDGVSKSTPQDRYPMIGEDPEILKYGLTFHSKVVGEFISLFGATMPSQEPISFQRIHR